MTHDETPPSQCPQWVRDLDFLHNPALHADPFPTLEQLRDECPVAWIEADSGYWLATKHKDVYAILRDSQRFSNAQISPSQSGSSAVRGDLGPALLIMSDAPDHLEYRSSLQHVFTPGTAAKFEPVARETSQRLLENIRERGECEFVSEFAIHLPGAVMLPAMGVPAEHQSELLEAAWGEEQKHSGANPDPEERMRIMRATRARQVEVFRTVLEDRHRTGPIGDDLLSVLSTACKDGEPLSMREQLNLALVIYNASLHTTTNTLANMMVFLSQHPQHRDQLTADPTLIPAAVEELMRWESIVTGGRLVTEDTEVNGKVLWKGQVVLYSTSSAGRDAEEMGDDANEVRFDRGPTRHLQFGAGPHRCLGSHIARMELRVALEEIHHAIPEYRLKPGTTPVRHTGQERATEQLWLVTQ